MRWLLATRKMASSVEPLEDQDQYEADLGESAYESTVTFAPNDLLGMAPNDEEEIVFTGWMWITSFAILTFGTMGIIFMVARETIKYCRRCQEREGIERAQSINALNPHHRTDGHLSTPGSPLGPRVFAPNIVLSAFSGPHR
ncbi:unnamed protein product [Notodromas monacha]|uniref:Uncharacterized protein n=1 Tax=Notodromas monacha TaxID=399045 RepID=A0A7R9C267_9CRUS|nr:unnamed protein product [Notodromas monacha]CAG0924786.1 unnamed protein product [Notodromas monacha]